MNEQRVTSGRPAHGRTGDDTRPYRWLAGMLLGLPVLAGALAYLMLSDQLPPGRCQGLGWGCSPGDRRAVLLGTVAAGPLLVMLLAVAAGCTAALRRLPRVRALPAPAQAFGGLAAAALVTAGAWAAGFGPA